MQIHTGSRNICYRGQEETMSAKKILLRIIIELLVYVIFAIINLNLVCLCCIFLHYHPVTPPTTAGAEIQTTNIVISERLAFSEHLELSHLACCHHDTDLHGQIDN